MLGKLAPFFGTAVLFFGIGVPHETVSARQMAPEYCRDLYFFGGHGLAEGERTTGVLQSKMCTTITKKAYMMPTLMFRWMAKLLHTQG